MGLTTGILLTDLTKAFDCISHELLIAKLNAYGFSKNALDLVYDYLSERKQRAKVIESFISSQVGYCPLIWMCHSRKIL